MKPTDVTDEINEAVCEAVGHWGWDGVDQKEIIAASVNAVFGDPTPITAEWLVANGYERNIFYSQSLYFKKGGALKVDVYSRVVTYRDEVLPTKTIGQLRALEIGLGIKPCQ